MRGNPSSADTVMGRRIAAALVDSVLVFGVLYAGMVGLGSLGLDQRAFLGPAVIIGFYLWYVFTVLGFTLLLMLHDYSPIWFVVGVGVWVVYGIVFEATLGATPGKLLTGLVVVGPDGDRPSLRGVVARNLLRYVDVLGFYLVGFVVLAVDGRRQRLGDRLGDTIVTRRSRTPDDVTGDAEETVSQRAD